MIITARYAATCSTCHRPIAPGQRIEWTRGTPTVRHADCHSLSPVPMATPGPRTQCVSCGGPLDRRAQQRGYRRCLECVDGGSRAHGGQSYRDRHGNFVLGEDD